MWLVALQNEGNFSHLDFSIYFAQFLVLGFDENVFTLIELHLHYIGKQVLFLFLGFFCTLVLKNIFFHTEKKK